MAGGWAKDGAVQEQIDISVQDAVEHVRSQLPKGDSLLYCQECEVKIPEARREAIRGVRLCINCQSEIESSETSQSHYNRRASKDSQLR
jgi:phage/conjugal plasmid C-4 type zinc finger TraR family protein